MATAKYGLFPYGPQNPGALVEFDVDPSTTEIYIGDIVEIVADKGVAQSAATNEDNVGVAVGFLNGDGIPVPYYGYPTTSTTADTGWKCIVNTDPNQLYMVHYYHASTALTAAYVGSTADIVVGTGNTTTGLSGAYITALSTGAATLYVVGLAPISGNAWGTDCELLVRLQEHIFNNVAAAGV